LSSDKEAQYSNLTVSELVFMIETSVLIKEMFDVPGFKLLDGNCWVNKSYLGFPTMGARSSCDK